MIVAEKQFQDVELHKVKEEYQRQAKTPQSDVGEYRKAHTDCSELGISLRSTMGQFKNRKSTEKVS